MSRRFLFLVLTLMACTFFVIGCGGSDDDAATDAQVATLQSQIDDLTAQLDANEITIAEYEAQVAALQDEVSPPTLDTLISRAAAELTTDASTALSTAVDSSAASAELQGAFNEVSTATSADDVASAITAADAAAERSVETMTTAFSALKAANATAWANFKAIFAGITADGFTAVKAVISKAKTYSYNTDMANLPTDIADELDDIANETCSTCHNDTVAKDGSGHQADYDGFADTSKLQFVFNSISTTDGTDVILNFDINYDEAGDSTYEDYDVAADALSSGLEQFRIYIANYVPASNTVNNSVRIDGGTIAKVDTNTYTVTYTFDEDDTAIDVSTADGFAYGYIALNPLGISNSAFHMTLYDDVASAAIIFTNGTVDTDYTQVANASACEKCHGTPYMKHGYRAAVDDANLLPDFVTCKVCHVDTTAGGHEDWQILYDDVDRYIEIHEGDDLTADEEAKYAYYRSVMADTHMSHNMEFAYPTNMANCITCHEGNLAATINDENFTYNTCQSCHAVDTLKDKFPKNSDDTLVSWHDFDDLATQNCNGCHKETDGVAPAFSDIHTGFDATIYADADTKYADEITVAISDVSYDADNYDVTFTVTAAGSAGDYDAADVIPAVMIGMYGYDTKDFIVNGHDRWDSNCNGTISRGDGDSPKGEFIFGEEETEGCENPYWTVVDAEGPVYTITAHLDEWSDMIDSGAVENIELAVMPETHDGIALNAVDYTYNLTSGAVADFFGKDIVDVDKCNQCHTQLATTFHGPERGGSITVCRMCHVTLSGGSHLEMQSRSIDSYVHAVHSFQAFDSDDVDFEDSVEAFEYEHHTQAHIYPNFTIKNCESCHNAGTYDVPDATKSLPGKLSASYEWNVDREIAETPAVVTGPASRACGSCHRAVAINADDGTGLSALNNHITSNGYTIEDSGSLLELVIDAFFE